MKAARQTEYFLLYGSTFEFTSTEKGIETGICYLRAGDSKGSLLVTPGFERLQYVLLHTNGEDYQLFKLKTKGHFQIWTRETLEQYGFEPRSANFDASKPIPMKKCPDLQKNKFTFQAKIRPLSDFKYARTDTCHGLSNLMIFLNYFA